MPAPTLLAGTLVLAAAATALASWTNPPGLLLRAHQADVCALHWARHHLLTTGALGVFATVVTALLTRSWDRRDRRRIDKPDTLLNIVYSMWMVGVLKPKLNEGSIPPRWRTAPDMVNPGIWPYGPPRRNSELISDGKAIAHVFDEAGRSLLIAGAAGSGKTVLLLRLAKELLAGAETGSPWHIPVVVELSSWPDQQEDFSSWLCDTLAATYEIPTRLTAAWVRDNKLALLLDGLDEVNENYRAACVKAINSYRRDHGTVPMAVCARTDALEHLEIKLNLRQAIEAQPFTDSEVDHYLSARLHEPPLSAVRAVVASDPGFRTPLMLPVIATACQMPAEPGLSRATRHEEVQRLAWAAYIQRMFKERPLKGSRYTEQQALRWLTTLARQLYDSPYTQFRIDTLTMDIEPAAPRKARHAEAPELAFLTAVVIIFLGILISVKPGDFLAALAVAIVPITFCVAAMFLPGDELLGSLLGYVEHFWRARRGEVPWRYRPFLNAMTERQLLLRPGRNYMFRHDSLRKYLAWP